MRAGGRRSDNPQNHHVMALLYKINGKYSELNWIRYTHHRECTHPRAGFEPAQNLSSGLVEWSCAVVITTTPRRQLTEVLTQLTEVPKKEACTSVFRNWEVPGNKEVLKESVMRTTIISRDQIKGIPPTLYDTRLNFNQIKNEPFILKVKSQLLKIDRNIDFPHVIHSTPAADENDVTKYGLQLLGSSLSYQLPHIDINFLILSNLDNIRDLYDNTME